MIPRELREMIDRGEIKQVLYNEPVEDEPASFAVLRRENSFPKFNTYDYFFAEKVIENEERPNATLGSGSSS